MPEHEAEPEEAVTIGASAGNCHAERHSELVPVTVADPNGWFAGPPNDPNRFQLLGAGRGGGEGITWRARYLGRLSTPLNLAVKQLRRPPGAVADWPTATDIGRWEDQKALLQYLRVQHLVSVLDIFVGAPPHFGEERTLPTRTAVNTPYVVMEWVPGRTLFETIRGVPASSSTLGERLVYPRHVALALRELHSWTRSGGNPALHRDVKPTNCILEPIRGLVLVDVGTMRLMGDGADYLGVHTPAYTAPEVLANPRASRRPSSDLYSLGALAYFCVLGEDPPVAARLGTDQAFKRKLLAVAEAAQVLDPAEFVDHLRLMLHPRPERRPADPLAWARKLAGFTADGVASRWGRHHLGPVRPGRRASG
jgi:serine/threonine protein kinase